ncbi:uncharacterized protein LOC107711325 isoform X2 [Sinocyclocheilus rhinocerous]|uniref:uncharacterized protein LOC107711325 isoform X2 n=1 Tax=Sinocyclocheilus rhinocerous TaxID=307959 RepID=UPI0007BA4782|nr:PREDICTED: uncharacterized protein LOC107711325 isoform X2 [Sinocyclocheilus rhinocerous]
MNAVNAVQLFILVWTFTAVCQADKNFSVSCDDVTGFVGKKVNLTCRVSQQCAEYCFKMYKFQYPKSFNDSTICKQEPPVNSCDQSNSFTCSYTPSTAMTEKFSFFAQANCGMETTEFTVDIADSSLIKAEDPESKDSASKDTAIIAAVGCFSIVLIIVIMTVICKTKPNFTKPCGFQKRMFFCIKHDEDNTTPPEDVI